MTAGAQTDPNFAFQGVAETADAVAAIHPKTVDGLQAKALVALDMLTKGQRKLDKVGVKGFSMWGGCVSIVKDVLRGVPA